MNMKYVKCAFSHDPSKFTLNRIYIVLTTDYIIDDDGNITNYKWFVLASVFMESTEQEYNKQEGIINQYYYFY